MEHSHADAELALIAPWVLAAVAVLVYGAGVHFHDRAGRRWERWRLVCAAGGCAAAAFAVSPVVLELNHADLRHHMAQHVVIGMLAPIAIVMSAPLTLALRTLTASTSRRLANVLRSPIIHVMSHPVTALVLNVGGMAVLYLTPLYSLSVPRPWAHHLMHIHFLAAGCLFAWAIAGPDPAPRRPSPYVRLAALFMGAAAHATLAKLMYARLWPRGTAASVDDVRAAAKIMYYGGDLAELWLAAILFLGWYRIRGTPRGRDPVFSAKTIPDPDDAAEGRVWPRDRKQSRTARQSNRGDMSLVRRERMTRRSSRFRRQAESRISSAAIVCAARSADARSSSAFWRSRITSSSSTCSLDKIEPSFEPGGDGPAPMPDTRTSPVQLAGRRRIIRVTLQSATSSPRWLAIRCAVVTIPRSA